MKTIIVALGIALSITSCSHSWESPYSRFEGSTYSDMDKFKEESQSYKTAMGKELIVSGSVCADVQYEKCEHTERARLLSEFMSRYKYADSVFILDHMETIPAKDRTMGLMELFFRDLNERMYNAKAAAEHKDLKNRLEVIKENRARNISCTSTRYGNTVHTKCN